MANRFGYTSTPLTSNRINMLAADFEGLANLDTIVNETMMRLAKKNKGLIMAAKNGNISINDLDVTFEQIVRTELGATLGKMRNKAVKAAREGGAGSASVAVSRRMYKDRYAGNINWSPSRKRKSSTRRAYAEGHQRDISNRTRELNSYYGPDRDFILRFLNGGTDERYVDPKGATGRGSKASWGRRGAITPRGFFHQIGADMELAAAELGETIVSRVEKLINKAIENKE